MLVMMTPSSGFYCQDVYDQALSLEKEVLKHARITATKKAIKAIKEGPLYAAFEATLYYSKDKKEVIISNEPIGIGLEGDKILVTVDGETIDTIRLNPDHTYAYIIAAMSSSIPISPPTMGEPPDEYYYIGLSVIKNGKEYLFGHHLFPTLWEAWVGTSPDKVVKIDTGRLLKPNEDFILGVDHQGDVIVFYVYRSSSKEFFKLYCDLSSGRVWRGSPSSEELERLERLADKVDEEVEKLMSNGGLPSIDQQSYTMMSVLYDMDNNEIIMVEDPSIRIARECNPRLYEFVEFLNS
ncbi:hypothetical protein, partial [Methanopyrus sp. KOL6]|uniref:hypothetical protein n=1 Tax=Methanopyrus sp. KOL6 TaxID=1937004 RepID=UPI0012F7E105